MGKQRKRYFDGSGLSAQSKTKKRHTENDDRPDPESRDFYYDEVDEFHNQRDKVHLDKALAVSSATSDEEVLGIGSEDDEDEEDGDGEGEGSEADDMGSDISGEDDEEHYLPSADAWGKRRRAYYSTDFTGDDRAGLSGSDEEVAELEEQEALSLQRRLLQQMTEDDFKLDSVHSLAEPAPAKRAVADIVQTDLSSLTEEEKFELLKQQSPELLSLIDEYREKSRAVDEFLEPVANALLEMDEDKQTAEDGFVWVIDKYELYRNYLLNLQFYFVLKAMRQPVDNHPVIDRIMGLKNLVNAMDEKYGHLDPILKSLAKRVASGLSIRNKWRSLAVKAPRSTASIGAEPVVKEGKKRVHWGPAEDTAGGVEGHDAVEDSEEGDGESRGKRGVSYEIEKNKGMTPKRKKEQRNPRVKNRSRFKKALHKKQSQVPNARREIQKYGGEVRGIKTNLVRSVKLQ